MTVNLNELLSSLLVLEAKMLGTNLAIYIRLKITALKKNVGQLEK